MTTNDAFTWRDLNTGVDPAWADPTLANGATDQAGTPAEPVTTRLEGPWGLPWMEGIEDPNWPTGLGASPDPSLPRPDVGKKPLPGAYEPAVRTRGPVQAWGHEPSGGWWGDQAVGRIMRFPANIPDRYDAHGVKTRDYRDELAASIAANSTSYASDQEVTDELIYYGG